MQGVLLALVPIFAWGPQLAGMAIIPSIIGAVIVVAVVSFFVGKSKGLVFKLHLRFLY